MGAVPHLAALVQYYDGPRLGRGRAGLGLRSLRGGLVGLDGGD